MMIGLEPRYSCAGGDQPDHCATDSSHVSYLGTKKLRFNDEVSN